MQDGIALNDVLNGVDKGLLGPGASFIGISHDDPDITAAEKLTYDACVTVDHLVEPEGDVGVQTIEGGRYAVFLHAGPYERFSETYASIYREWLPRSGEQLRDIPCFELYLNSPEDTPPDDLRSEIWIPLQ